MQESGSVSQREEVAGEVKMLLPLGGYTAKTKHRGGANNFTTLSEYNAVETRKLRLTTMLKLLDTYEDHFWMLADFSDCINS